MAPTLKKAQPWTPHAQAAPITEHEGETFYTTANGTHTLSGGWQLEYENVVPGPDTESPPKSRYNGNCAAARSIGGSAGRIYMGFMSRRAIPGRLSPLLTYISK